MNPTTTTTNNNTNPALSGELDSLITRAETLQRSLRLNDAEFVAQKKEFLPSLDTWQRTLKARDPQRLTERNAAKWTLRLRRLLDDAEGSGGSEAFYPLPILAEAVSLYNRLQGAPRGITVGWLNGTTGSGKSVALRFLRRKYPRETLYMLVTRTMCENRGAIVRGLAAAVGVEEESGTDATFRLITARLLARPATLLLDEMHVGGIEMVSIIKSITELAPLCRFLLTTWPDGFSKLCASTRRFETRQLVGRSLRPFNHTWQKGPTLDDIEVFLKHAVPEMEDAGTRRLLANEFHGATALWGFRLLQQVVDSARAEADARDTAITAELLRSNFAPLSTDVVA
jgi:hypothetical protein